MARVARRKPSRRTRGVGPVPGIGAMAGGLIGGWAGWVGWCDSRNSADRMLVRSR